MSTMKEEEILDVIIKEYSWEEVLFKIVVAENLDPWDIDIVKLAEAFAHYLKRLREMDFRIPAKVILTCSILLRMKSEALRLLEEDKKRASEKQEPIDVSDVPQLQPPIVRRPIRKVTLEELVVALEKAFQISERKETRWKTRVQKMEVEEDDIQERIEWLYNEVIFVMEKLHEDRIAFSIIVGEWNPQRVVKILMPLLHLIQERKLDYEQEGLFTEIFVTKPRPHEEDEIQKDEESPERKRRKKHG